MNREIKFRAWHIPTRKMFDVFSWCKDCVFEYSFDGVGTSPTLPTETKDCELMQYTGLLDKNGVEIYEGDILDLGTKILKVVFYEGCFRTLYFDEKGKLSSYRVNGWIKREVIGNIYENPELL